MINDNKAQPIVVPKLIFEEKNILLEYGKKQRTQCQSPQCQAA